MRQVVNFVEQATTISRRNLIRGTAGVVAAATLSQLATACSTDGDNKSNRPDGTLVIGYSTGIDTLNPFASANGAWQNLPIAPRLAEQLLQSDPLQPGLATSWTVDGPDLTFNLRSNGKWLDGSPITAADVVFTIETLVKYPGPTATVAGIVQGIAGAKAIDPNTVVVSWDAPNAQALGAVASMPILPKYVWEQYATGDGSQLLTAQLDETGLQGGAFKIVKFQKNEIIQMAPHSDYYGEKPQVKQIGYQYFASDQSLIQALSTETVDLIQTTLGVPVGLSSLDEQKFAVGYKQPGLVVPYLAFNSDERKPQNKELQDPRVRLALAYVSNQDQIVSTVYFGKAMVAGSYMPPSFDESDPSLGPYSFDPAKANEILDGLGYERNSSGIRIANGHPMAYTLNVTTDLGSYKALSEAVVSGWATAGVSITAKPLDGAANYAATNGPDAYLTNDVTLTYNIFRYDPGLVLQGLITSAIGGYNDALYSNNAYDELYIQQMQELDPEKRKAILFKIQALLYSDKPIIPLVYIDAWSASRLTVKGVPLTPRGNTPLQAPNLWATGITIS